MDSNAHAIAAAYALLAKSYSQLLPRQTLALYASTLQHHHVQDVKDAMQRLRTRLTRLPSPQDILDDIEALDVQVTPEMQANEVAAAIWDSIGKDGYTNPDRARRRIGEVGWYVVERMGGWQQLCSNLRYEERGTFYAQCRALASSKLAQDARHDTAAKRLPAAQSLVAC